ncbi:MAG TPA: hypothetical protein VFD70_31615 [Anaerolineae bacterium]|nr:hypothetical protein [Anaerolineae bacterium]
MSGFDSLGMYARFSTALRSYLHHTMTLDEAYELVQTRLARRCENFLRLVERSIYGNPRSPYLALLKHAGCEFGDLQTLVRQHDLEGALYLLREEGVYIAFEEWKGRAPIVRGSLELPMDAHALDNPFLVKHFYVESGGSTGVSLRVPHDLEQNAALAPNIMIGYAAHNVLNAPMAVWRGILPDGSGINNILYPAYFGEMPEKWFSPVKPFDAKNPKYTLASYYFVLLSRLYGASVPFPEYLPVSDAIVVARWAADALRRRGKCRITATVSRGMRVALAAQEAGIDLTGTGMMVGGEPLTPEKARRITDSGARVMAQYTMSETGRIGNGCAHPLDCTDVHLARDAFALIPYAHTIEGFDVNVNAFHMTTLLPSASKIMLNVETDDFGVIEERDCGCLWSTLGFKTHLRGIHSYRKLTGEGVTLVSSDMVHILEHELPARFGGSPLDYQLLEQEDAEGLTRLFLLIHPRLQIADEQAVIQVVMNALRNTSAAADAARAIWAQANTLQVKRMEPILTSRGKFNPLHIQRHVKS